MISILLVDDEVSLLEALKLYLEDSGEYHVDTFISALEALEHLRHNSYDAIISDYEMPEMDALEFLKILKASGNMTPFIIFTGKGREEVVIDAFEGGADYYLQKGDDPVIQFAVLKEKIYLAIERRRFEQQLKESELKFRQIFESLEDLYYQTDQNGKITLLSPSVYRLSGWSEEELIGQDATMLYADPHDREDFLIEISKTGSIRNYELILIKRDGTRAPVTVSGNLMYHTDGTIMGVAGSLRDISQQKQAEEALIMTNRKLTILSSITRHDILNQVTGLLGYLEILRDMVADAEEAGYLEKCLVITETIENQIAFTKLVDDIRTISVIWQYADQMISKVLRGYPISPIDCQTDLDDIQIYGDPIMEKVIFTLIENSIRHGGAVSKIRFSYQIIKADCILYYEDDGNGIPGDEKEKIFICGYGKHTGLGMYLVRDILLINGMTIQETGTEGTGVRFEIKIPKGKWRVLPHNSEEDCR